MSIYNTAVRQAYFYTGVLGFIAIMVLGVASYIQLPGGSVPRWTRPPRRGNLSGERMLLEIQNRNVTKILEYLIN